MFEICRAWPSMLKSIPVRIELSNWRVQIPI